jgi:hypothetical protein
MWLTHLRLPLGLSGDFQLPLDSEGTLDIITPV